MDVDDKMMMMLTVMMMMMTTMRSEAQLPLTCQTWPTVRQGRLVGGQANHHRQLRCHQIVIVDDDIAVIIDEFVVTHCPARATSGRTT